MNISLTHLSLTNCWESPYHQFSPGSVKTAQCSSSLQISDTDPQFHPLLSPWSFPAGQPAPWSPPLWALRGSFSSCSSQCSQMSPTLCWAPASQPCKKYSTFGEQILCRFTSCNIGLLQTTSRPLRIELLEGRASGPKKIPIMITF